MASAVIGVYPSPAYQKWAVFFDALAKLEPVRFCGLANPADPAVGAVIGIDVPPAELIDAGAPGRRVFLYQPGRADARNGVASGESIEFSKSSALDPVLRGQRLPDSGATASLEELKDGAEVLASRDGKPVWARQATAAGSMDLLSAEPPSLESGGFLHEHLGRGNFMRVLPLVHFLREVAGADSWQRPPLRACFMFDDPNLHASSFGYIGYRQLVESAIACSYHVSMATIPLDAWYVHRPTAEFFQEKKKYLSLLVHGNNHTRYELARSDSADESLRLAAQALRRIDKLEQSSGVEVARVMAAPHAACNEVMAGAMARLGYDAACISRGSLMHYNPGVKWPVTIGLEVAEFFGGLPILPRFGLVRDCQADLVLAAYFGHALILVGHHEDVKGGYGLLEDIAGFINRLGPVDWTDLSRIVRSSYLQQVSGETLRVRAYTRHLQVAIPAAVRRLVVETAWEPAAGESVQVEQAGRTMMLPVTDRQATLELANKTDEINVSIPGPNGVDYRGLPAPRAGAWPVVRRVLTEGRDRVNSLLRR